MNELLYSSFIAKRGGNHRVVPLPSVSGTRRICSLIVLFSISLFSEVALSQEYLVLKMVLNEEERGDFIFVRTGDNDFLLKREDLNRLKFKEEYGLVVKFDEEEYVSLESIDGLTFEINIEDGVLDIIAAPHLFNMHEFDTAYERSDRFTPGTASAFLNYGATYNNINNDSFFNISGELGGSAGDFFGSTTFEYQKTENSEKIVRLLTTLTKSDRENLHTISLGDVLASSGAAGSKLNMGGINVSKNYSIAPSLIRFPAPDFKVSVDTPSEVEVYLNNSLLRTEKLSPGEFVFKDLPATVGAGTARVVIRGSDGRERTFIMPYYYSNRLLQKGLNEYDYSIGFLREELGQKNFSY